MPVPLPGFWLGPNRSFAWRYAYRCRAAPRRARDPIRNPRQARIGWAPALGWIDPLTGKRRPWRAPWQHGRDIGNAGRPTRRHTAGLIRRPLLQIVANCLWIDTRALFLAARYERRSAKRRAPPGQAKEGRIDPAARRHQDAGPRRVKPIPACFLRVLAASHRPRQAAVRSPGLRGSAIPLRASSLRSKAASAPPFPPVAFPPGKAYSKGSAAYSGIADENARAQCRMFWRAAKRYHERAPDPAPKMEGSRRGIPALCWYAWSSRAQSRRQWAGRAVPCRLSGWWYPASVKTHTTTHRRTARSPGPAAIGL